LLSEFAGPSPIEFDLALEPHGMRSALSISLPGARRRGQLALPADEAAVFVPVMMAAQKPVATTPSITIETAGIVVRARRVLLIRLSGQGC
jgi:hypothetical protein